MPKPTNPDKSKKRDKRVKRDRIYPPVLQQDPNATPEQVVRALANFDPKSKVPKKPKDA